MFPLGFRQAARTAAWIEGKGVGWPSGLVKSRGVAPAVLIVVMLSSASLVSWVLSSPWDGRQPGGLPAVGQGRPQVPGAAG